MSISVRSVAFFPLPAIGLDPGLAPLINAHPSAEVTNRGRVELRRYILGAIAARGAPANPRPQPATDSDDGGPHDPVGSGLDPHSPVITATTDAVGMLVETCDVCDHEPVQHDPIARRYCAATFANALTRRCICTMHTA
jgi:hypothetical protein